MGLKISCRNKLGNTQTYGMLLNGVWVDSGIRGRSGNVLGQVGVRETVTQGL